MTRLFDLLYHQVENLPNNTAVSSRDASGNWISYSSQEVLDAAEQAASGLIKAGLRPGEKVAIVSYKNRPEWLIMDFAIQMAGGISIPLYPTISIGEYEYILNEAEVKMAFCGALDLYDKLRAAQKTTPTLKHIYTFDSHPDRPFWKDIFDTEGISALQPIKDSIKDFRSGHHHLYLGDYRKPKGGDAYPFQYHVRDPGNFEPAQDGCR